MILHHINFALRNIRRNLLVSFINVLGLSIGLSACLIIFLIVWYELSFDRFHRNGDDIFRMYSFFSGGDNRQSSGVPTAFARFVKDHFTGVESVAGFHTMSANVAVFDSKGNRNELGQDVKMVLVPPDYFKVFDFYDWIVGNSTSALTQPFSVVLTENQARTYFGNVDLSTIVGKQIYYLDSLNLTVSGVVAEIDKNTDLDFTDFVSLSTVQSSWLNKFTQLDSWQNISTSSQLFIRLSPETNPLKINSQLLKLAEIYKSHNTSQSFELVPKLQPLENLHFNSDLGIFNHSHPVVKMSTLKMLVVIAVLLLTIAVINFINLETAQSFRYVKEVGLRKALGSSQRELIVRFLTQTSLLCFVSGIISACCAQLYFTYLGFFAPQNFELDFADAKTAGFMVAAVVFVTLLAGIYPASVLSSNKPANALRGGGNSIVARKSATVRKGLTIFQLGFSQILIVGTIVVVMQLNYVLDKDLGFTADAVIQVRAPSREKERLATFKSELLQHPEVAGVTVAGNPPLSTGYSSMRFTFNNGKEVITNEAYTKQGDTSYLNVYGLRLIAGRNVMPSDTAHEFLANEAFLKLLHITDPEEALGKSFDKGIIVGVVRDFHGQPLWNEIKPTLLSYRPGGTFGIKISTANRRITDIQKILTKIKESYQKAFQEENFEYYFLDDQIRQMYANELRFGDVVTTSTSIGILISCIGLFGYFSFSITQRTKEIGIRKVCGATILSILVLVCGEFLKLVFIAFLIAAPIAFYLTRLWLEKFAYKIDLTGYIFFIAASVSVLICLMTIVIRAFYAASANPVKSLKQE
jgi:putative ABC transport system permease protein